MDIIQWFVDNNHTLPVAANNRQFPTKMQLFNAVHELNIIPVYAITVITNYFDHIILKTSPYHCELQPIEWVWSMVKEPIVHDPRLDKTAASLKKRLMGNFDNIQEHWLIAVWKKTLKIVKKYVETDEREPIDQASDIIMNVNVIETEEVEDLEVDSNGD